jgi:hypothetical protein
MRASKSSKAAPARRQLSTLLANHGGKLTKRFSWEIQRTLEEHPPSALMQILWRLVISGYLQGQAVSFDLYNWRRTLERDGLTVMLRKQFRDFLAPQVRLREPFHVWGDHEGIEGRVNEPRRLKDLVDYEIVLSTENVHYILNDMSKNDRWIEALPNLLFDATTLLRDTLDLMRELEGANDWEDGSFWQQPSISEHSQNQYFYEWTALVDLIRDAWLATAKIYPGQAIIEVERWLTIRYPLFRRLVFFASTYSTLFAPRKSLEWLLMDDNWWLWSDETEREALRLLVTIITKLGTEDREILERAILQGPPRKMFPNDIEPGHLQEIFDREIWMRLAKYSAGGASLSTEAAIKLQTLTQQYPSWRLAEDESDEFPAWQGDRGEWHTFLNTPKSCRDLMNWLHEHPKRDEWQEDDWSNRCKSDFRRAVFALIHLAHRNEWITDRWREALQVWSDEALVLRSWHCVGTTLKGIPDVVIKELEHTLSWWLESVAKSFNGNEDIFFLLIRKVLELNRNKTVESNDDPVSRAINHPVGHITEAALRWWYRQSPEDKQCLPDVLKPIFTDLCNTHAIGFLHGRVLLAAHVISLFRVDYEWTMQYLLPLFNWQISVVEARAVWEGFLWSPRLYRPLIEAIKPQFLAAAQHYDDLGKHGRQYAALLTFAALEPLDTFSRKELVTATRSLPVNGLQRAAETVVQSMGEKGEQRTEYWRNRILPYLKYIWPKSQGVITPGISKSFAKLCVTAQEAFPEAIKLLKPWLQPIPQPDFVLNLLQEGKFCEQFPEESLTFLGAIIGEPTQWVPKELKTCLNIIEEVQPELRKNIIFQKLIEFFRRHGRA